MDKKGIAEVVQIYFDACYEGNREKMDRVFRPEAHIYGMMEGDSALTDTPRDEFVDRLGRNRQSSNNDWERRDEIHLIEFTSEHTAVAKVSLLLRNTLFNDLLIFVNRDGEWRVISKMYHGQDYKKS